MLRQLHYQCPTCETKLRAVDGLNTATQVVRRACPRKECGKRWQLTITPAKIRRGAGYVDTATFTEIERNT